MPWTKKDDSKSDSLRIIQTGFAMFSMFFGSGNTIFPIRVGGTTGAHVFYGTFGFSLTGVLVPFVGLIAMFLFDGDYFAFFRRLGKIPAWLIILTIMGLIGPFAIIPRCILVAYATIQSFSPGLNLYFFISFSCLLIFFCTYKRRRVIEILGFYLTPILLFSLLIIILKGFFSSCEEPETSLTVLQSFRFGLLEGYNTMDIFAGFMFSSLLLISIKGDLPKEKQSQKEVLALSIKAGLLGILCLGFVYWGMSYIASFHALCLEGVSSDKVLSKLTLLILGKDAGIIVCLAVSFACLTTAISLSLVFSEFMSDKVFQNKVSYKAMLAITLLLSFLCSLLEYDGVQAFVIPVLKVGYPSLILLAILNILYKIIGFKPVKFPCFLVFFLTLAFYLLT